MVKPFLRAGFGLLLLGLLLGGGQPTPAEARSPVFAVAYRTIPSGHEMDATELPFWASHFDVLISPKSSYLAPLKALNPNLLNVVYTNYYCLYVGDDMYQAMAAYAQAHGISLESMLLHFSVSTTVTLGGETHTLPAGSRVPTYNWYGTGGNLTLNGARIVTNPGSASFRDFLVGYAKRLTTTSYGGASYDGLFVDNSAPYTLTDHLKVSSGGTIAEYPGTLAQAATAFDADIVKCHAAVQPALAAIGKVQTGNLANYESGMLYPYEWGAVREGDLRPRGTTVSMEGHAARYSSAAQAGARSLPITMSISNTEDRLTALALYYTIAYTPGYAYYNQAITFAGPLNTDQWSPVMECEPGNPLGTYYLFAQGIDPTSPSKYTGTCTQVQAGPNYVFSDSSKNWGTNALANLWFIDKAGNAFRISSNTATSFSFYSTASPAPVAGSYAIGTYRYRVLARDFEKALILWKGLSEGVSDTSTATNTTHPLPITSGAPAGSYSPLDYNNVQGAATTSITLHNGQGAILMKPGTGTGGQPSLSLSLSVSPSTAAPGQQVSYSITYRNSGTAAAPGVVVSGPVPSGTSYVAGSASSGGTLQGGAVVWSLGDVAPGQTGTLTYKVQVQ